MTYRGFIGTVEYSEEDEVFHGKLLFIPHLVTYEAKEHNDLEEQFELAIMDTFFYKRQTNRIEMNPKEWAAWFVEKYPESDIDELISTLRSAAKYGIWHKPKYAEMVIRHLEEHK